MALPVNLLHTGSSLFFIFLGIVGISFLVGIHELGHFFFCKLFGVRTPSFSIGFGPRLIEKKIGDTLFSLSAIPLGGYVEIAGAQEVGQGEQAHAASTDQDSFAVKPYYQQLLILLGGIMVNLCFAYCAMTIVFMGTVPATGLISPYNAQPIISSVAAGSAAEQAGLRAGDAIISVTNGSGKTLSMDTTTGMPEFLSFVRAKPDATAPDTLTITVTRDGSEQQATVVLGACSPRVLGAQFDLAELPPHTFTEALKKAVSVINYWIAATFRSLKNMITRCTTQGLGGPVAVISQIKTSAQQSLPVFIIMLCFVSVGLACLNLVPLPIFDGGQVLFYTLEAATGVSLDKIRLYVHYVSWVTVLILTVYLTWRDVLKIFIS